MHGNQFVNLEAFSVRHYTCHIFFHNKSIDIEHSENKKFHFFLTSEATAFNHHFHKEHPASLYRKYSSTRRILSLHDLQVFNNYRKFVTHERWPCVVFSDVKHCTENTTFLLTVIKLNVTNNNTIT